MGIDTGRHKHFSVETRSRCFSNKTNKLFSREKTYFVYFVFFFLQRRLDSCPLFEIPFLFVCISFKKQRKNKKKMRIYFVQIDKPTLSIFLVHPWKKKKKTNTITKIHKMKIIFWASSFLTRYEKKNMGGVGLFLFQFFFPAHVTTSCW
jgi:hypothetical protein